MGIDERSKEIVGEGSIGQDWVRAMFEVENVKQKGESGGGGEM